MDLGAYAQIDDLGDLLVKNNIIIERLRGLRLMKDEEPVSEEELTKIIEEAKLNYAVDWLQQHSDFIWSSEKAQNKHESFIYGKDKYGYEAVVEIDFSKVNDRDKKHIEDRWKMIEERYTSQFTMFNKYCGKDVLYVHARQGGGNRPDYPINTNHPMYLGDVDDAFDKTYCDIYYDLSKGV